MTNKLGSGYRAYHDAMNSSGDHTKPSLSLLVKLGSIAVHVDEMLSPLGHNVDREAIKQLLVDPEVTVWIEQMTAEGLLPVQRWKKGSKAREALEGIRRHLGQRGGI